MLPVFDPLLVVLLCSTVSPEQSAAVHRSDQTFGMSPQ